MSLAGEPAPGAAVAPRTRARVERATALRWAAVAALLALVVLALPALVSTYWLQISTSVAIYSIVALGLALLIGRVGLVSLNQIALLAIGGWVALRLGFATSLPFPVLLLATGLITGVIGTLIGLPALRLSGLHLALITLMAAAAITLALQATNFPNGGPGFLGYSPGAAGSVSASLHRPLLLASDAAYYRTVVVVGALMFVLAAVHVRGKAGRAWAAIRQSQPAAIAAGVNVTLYKLWAFALASFLTGVAGGLLAASAGGLTTYGFPTQDSITLLAVVLMGGIYSSGGPIVAALLLKLLPELLKNWGLPPDLLTILFGVGVLQVMLTAPAGLVV
ncbi:MAG TPA: branched-chain amino acid ABC transporter permease [Candidatus Eisenbacteria bacterium]|nr:branched-chain amino acid ABC transporter permease [Candidatus Eisenbacteria bacterium]